MIIFHEGMPGSGKSYAAMVDHIIPALKKGRKVYARMNGLDRVRIADAGAVDRADVDRLLIDVSEEDVRELCKCRMVDGQRVWSVDADSLVVLDELQNYFPQQRSKLDEETTRFVAEHRHRGLDIVPMGQLLKDCHRLWVNRTNRKVQFLNKDVVGKPDEYKWIMYVGKPDNNGNVEFVEVSKGDGSYDKKYFGTYASHQEGTENTERLVDDRANIFKSPVFRKWLPILGVVTLAAVGYLVHLFSGGLAVSTKPEASAPGAKPVKVVTTTQKGNDAAVTVVESEQKKPAEVKTVQRGEEWDMPDLVTDHTTAHRIRLAGVVRSARGVEVLVEWRDNSMRLVDTLNAANLKLLGWSIMVSDDGRMGVLVKPGYRYVMTAWELPKPVGKVTDETQRQIRQEGMREAAPRLALSESH